MAILESPLLMATSSRLPAGILGICGVWCGCVCGYGEGYVLRYATVCFYCAVLILVLLLLLRFFGEVCAWECGEGALC